MAGVLGGIKPERPPTLFELGATITVGFLDGEETGTGPVIDALGYLR